MNRARLHKPEGSRSGSAPMSTVEDGLIAEHWACRDDAGMLRQLGFAG